MPRFRGGNAPRGPGKTGGTDRRRTPTPSFFPHTAGEEAVFRFCPFSAKIHGKPAQTDEIFMQQFA
ncbi:MAG TPA: hypothetical protein DDX51_04095 [Clostridiales bacterium]|nr:hypothetical protein [Clostridiales bacterium]